ncbi:hypothetical protein SAMN05421833_11526 [Microbispora rosea]|uniref:ATP-grasp domain-containing protein n=1 Tax=Microbispora rosea TaxID=58117 RepID=A0A1N7DMC2_9ACTN|nr:hypothetical protein [Microbispora rosea]SIR77009.1 hypothetical protein SAMN05421833_11526 [Microbispora rosea]
MGYGRDHEKEAGGSGTGVRRRIGIAHGCGHALLSAAGAPGQAGLGPSCGPHVTVDLRGSLGSVSWRLSEPGPATDAAPCVVLADRAGCAEFAVLQDTLHHLGVPSVRVDAESVAALRLSATLAAPARADRPTEDRPAVDRPTTDGAPAASGGVAGGRPCAVLDLDGRRIAPTVVWARHFSPRAMPASASAAQTLLRAESWHAVVRQLCSLAPASLPGNRPGRLEQLAGAAAAGIRVPRTIVTTDPAGAAAAMPGRRVVVKVVGEHFVETSPGLLTGVLPEIAARAEVLRRPALDYPVIVQEHVEHDAELRVYHVAGAVHAYAVGKRAPDSPWREAAEVTVTPVAAPPAVADAVRGLASLWGLTYGAFDLLLSAGEVVFLEVNTDGDWRWFEAKAGGRPVSTAVALAIRTLHLTALGIAGPPSPPELVDFLLLGARTLGSGR